MAGAGEPPGQKNPGAQRVALAGDVEPAAQPKPGAAEQAPEQAAEPSPGPLPKKPAGHSEQAAEPAEEKVPAGHSAQVALDVAPVAALTLPEGQAIASTDDSGQKKPAGQSRGAPLAQK